MSGGMPELGSKISLISKADIRYEGRLFTVDPQECTIALANVRSFGTEDRETQLPVAPQNQVYEYILFRGSDIKDIRVVNNVNSIPNDPAIVQMTVQPSMSQQSYQPQPSYAHPMMGPMGGQYGTPYGMTMGTMGPVMGMPTAARDPRGPINKQPSVLDLISGGSRSTTPTSSLLTRKSPTIDQGIQVGHQQQTQQQQQQGGKLGDKTNMRNIQPARRDHDSHGGKPGIVSQYNEGKRDQMKQDGQMQGQSNHAQGGRGNRGGWINRGNMRGRGRGRGGFRNQIGNTGAKPKNTLKFDNDYDFEQANTEFEELRSQLAKTKIDTGADNEKKDDSGNETGAGEGEPEEEPEIIHYDKSKSFFDNISCEAVERSKGRFQRTDWRTERKLNSETFGVASTRRGGFRGRGYYNRGMGGMYRGGGGGTGGSGFRGGYRGSRGGNRKPVNQQQPNNPGSQNQRMTNEQPTTQSQQNSRVVSF
ncbi:protein LSM14 homolog car-1 isoform X2 [Hylaeus anthracinus]|uniref:protein LSM14 homolog car-1 isoform X2 n=1 Tax=Hylaeus anthracinus TaxID=313031 RepID=UPI0023B8E6B2|nr:protein LSM14 homolog car-1 isoform X2 [Hylaeus anthracinus]